MNKLAANKLITFSFNCNSSLAKCAAGYKINERQRGTHFRRRKVAVVQTSPPAVLYDSREIWWAGLDDINRGIPATPGTGWRAEFGVSLLLVWITDTSGRGPKVWGPDYFFMLPQTLDSPVVLVWRGQTLRWVWPR